MNVTRIDNLSELSALPPAWDELAGGVPFRQWEWCATWWRHYGGGQLFTLVVRDIAGELVAIAPWYVDRHPTKGRVVQFLGSGEVCSDYQTVLCLPGREEEAAAALAGWLTASNNRRGTSARDAWDLLEFAGIEAADAMMSRLTVQLAQHGSQVQTQPGMNCWRLELPATWDDYLAKLSKSHRAHVRRFDRRVLSSGRAAWRTVATLDQLPAAFDRLVDLHQRRWQSQGEPGVFSSPRFTAFHREMAANFLARHQLRLHWLELDGRLAAAEYHFTGSGVIYVYQGGMEPDLAREEPGSLAKIALLKHAIADGYQAIDFLRGDEPYKPHWRAEPRACLDLRVIPKRFSSRLRHSAWQAGKRVKRWLTREGVESVQGSGFRQESEK